MCNFKIQLDNNSWWLLGFDSIVEGNWRAPRSYSLRRPKGSRHNGPLILHNLRPDNKGEKSKSIARERHPPSKKKQGHVKWGIFASLAYKWAQMGPAG